MARMINVQGKLTGIPGVYQQGIALAGPQAPGVLESGVVAIVGECRGSIQPKVAFEITSPSKVKAALGSGVLYDAARFAFKPSRDLDVRGASKLVVVRVNPATRASSTLSSSAPASLITLSAVPYGSEGNAIKRTVAAGSGGGLGRKLTLSRAGENDEVGDDLGKYPPLLIRYKGSGTTATMTISATALATEVDSAADLNLTFAAYPTLLDLVNAINADSDYEAVAGIQDPAEFLPENLDRVVAADIKTETATISLASASATTFTGTYTGLDNDDVIKVGGEYLFVSNAGASTVERGFIDSAPAAHSSASAVTFYAAGATTYAMIAWVNQFSLRCVAERASSSNAGRPATAVEAALTGGSEGTSSSSDWQDALNALASVYANILVVCSDSSTVHGYLKTHMANRWGSAGLEAVAHTGAASQESLSALKLRQRGLQDPNTSLWFQDVQRENDKGVATWYAPWALAAMAAGIQAGTPLGTPHTYKTLECSDLRANTAIKVTDDDTANDLIKNGISLARMWDNDFRVLRCLSTYTASDDSWLIAPNTRSCVAWTVYKVRSRIRQLYLGKRGVKGDVADIKGTLVDILNDIRDIDGAIVEGSRLVNGQSQLIPAYDNLSVVRSGNVVNLSYLIVPAEGNDFIPVSTQIGVLQAAA